MSRARANTHSLPFDRRLPKEISDYADAFRAIKKEIFEKAGGYFEDRATGEDKIAMKAGEQAIAAEGAKAYHYNPESLGDVIESAAWFGKGEAARVKWFGIIGFLFKYSIFRSVPIGIIRAFKFKKPFFIIFKIIFDFAVTIGFIKSLSTGDNKK